MSRDSFRGQTLISSWHDKNDRFEEVLSCGQKRRLGDPKEGQEAGRKPFLAKRQFEILDLASTVSIKSHGHRVRGFFVKLFVGVAIVNYNRS